MTTARLLFLAILIVSANGYAQSTFVRVAAGFLPMAGGKTEWLDLDNDADLDLLYAGYDGSTNVTVVYENVDGTLTQRLTDLPALNSFASADYDKDGDIDILGFNQGAFFTKLFRNNGGFSFSPSLMLGNFSPSSAVWLDIDNDEDLDILLVGNVSIPKLFENTDAGFVEVAGTNFPSCKDCNSDATDFNGDGRVDILFTGGGLTVLYFNEGNKKFQQVTDVPFQQLQMGDAASGDFDSDGDFDILLTGMKNSSAFTAIYEYKNGRFVERTDLGITPVVTQSSSGLLWFNINNDGQADIFVSGTKNPSDVFAGIATVYKKNGELFTSIGDSYLSFDGFMGSYDAGDFNNDGDMDLAFQGSFSSLEGFPSPRPTLKRISGYYDNRAIGNVTRTNTPPVPPNVASFREGSYRKEMYLKWGDGSDAETPAAGLFYNFYLRDDNQKWIFPNVNFANGNILTSNSPNGMNRAGYAFDMPEGNLYYAVQSIDGAKRGSVFSTEKEFYHINGPEAASALITDQQHINLAWLDHSSLETNFEVLRSTSPTSGYTSLATLAANATTYNDTFSFSTETPYYYRIRGYNSQASLYDSLVMVIPNRATNLTARSSSATNAVLTWQDESQYEIAYVIERKLEDGDFVAIDTVEANVSDFEETTLLAGSRYEYRVIALGVNGALAPLVSVSITTNAMPQGNDFELRQDEDKTLAFTSNDFTNHFTDANEIDSFTQFKIVTLPENGTLFVYTDKAVIGQEVTSDLFGFITFVPYDNWVGTTSLGILPSDGKDYASQIMTISLTFNQVNDPPAFSILTSKVVDEDFVLIEPVYWQPYVFYGEESQTITYTVSPQTSDIVNLIVDAAQRMIHLTPVKDQFGEVVFTLTADDGQPQNNTYSQKITVTVRPVNDQPVLAPIADVSTELSSTTIDLTVIDPDNNIKASMFSALSSNTNIVKNGKMQFADTPDGKIRMTILSEDKEGSTRIGLTLSDGGFFVDQQFEFTRLVVITKADELPNQKIVTFPNPTQDDLYIQRPVSKETITFMLADAMGRQVQSGIIDKPLLTVDLREYAPGVYYLNIMEGERIIAFKKIVKP